MPTPNDDPKELGIESPPSGEEEIPSEPGEGTPEPEGAPSKKTAEARINELVGKVKELEDRLQEEKPAVETAPIPPTAKVTPQVQQAIDYLKNLGFVHKEEMEERIRTAEDRSVLNSEHIRLVNTYDGSDGRPKYEKSEVEKFMRDQGVYNPEIAYEQLHKTELLDWGLKQAEEKKKQRPYVDKSGSSTASREENTITREKIAEAMKTPEGRIWYEKNRDKILTLMQQGQL